MSNASVKQLMAVIDRDCLKAIFVYQKTLTITNGHMLIRRYIDLPDGYYLPHDGGGFISCAKPELFPNVLDLEQKYLKSPTDNIRQTLSTSVRGLALDVAKTAKDKDHRTVWDSQGFWTHDVSEDEERTGVAYQTGLPFPLELNALYVSIALTELASYDDIYLIKSASPEEPLILGLNWGSCVMVMPMVGEYYRRSGDIRG